MTVLRSLAGEGRGVCSYPRTGVPRQRSEPSALEDAARNLQWGGEAREPMPQDPAAPTLLCRPNSPQGGAPGCERGSGPEAEGTLAAAAASAAAAFPPPRSQSISVQCRLPPPSRAREKEGGPRMRGVLPRGPGPASPPRPPFQHRGQRPARSRERAALPARQQPVSLSAAWALRDVLIPSASCPPTRGGLRPSVRPSRRDPLGEHRALREAARAPRGPEAPPSARPEPG